MEVLDSIQEQILNKINALVVVLNKNGEADYVNRQATKLFGYSQNELLGENWFKITRFNSAEGQAIKQKLMAMFINKEIGDTVFEHEFKTQAGAKKWIKWNISFLNDNQIISIGTDVTDKKNTEEKLLVTNANLIDLNKSLVDSITYAKRIQHSILQSYDYIKTIFNNHFVFYKPKDIVSGDFYFFYQNDDYKYVIVADCTGHGVPGAMMSMLANGILKEVLQNKRIVSPAQILYEVDKELQHTINQYTNQQNSDGMDMAVVAVSKRNNRLHYAGAFNSAILIKDNKIKELKASKFPIGFFHDTNKVFEEQVILLNPNDQLFLFSDGYADQFGGDRNKKMNNKIFKEILLAAKELDISEQKAFIEYNFNNWKQQEPQTDDVVVVGIKL